MPINESAALRALIDDRYSDLQVRCSAAGLHLHDASDVTVQIRRTLMASDFAFDICRASQSC